MQLLPIDAFIAHLRASIQAAFGNAEELRLGTSRFGHPIPAFKIPGQSRRAVFLGFPHPNEPLGELILEAVVREAIDRYSPNQRACWYLVPVWDLDGARENEAWWSGIVTVERMIDHWYRPAPSEQVEWAFPLDYGDVRFDQPKPETEAVQRLLDVVHPEVLMSLHNSVFPGSYTLISPQGASLAPRIHETLCTHGLRPLSPCPIPYVETYADGVFGLPHARLEIDYLRKLDPRGSLSFYDNGAASFDYVGSSCLSFVMELPLFDWASHPDDGHLRRRDMGARHLAAWEQLWEDLEAAFADEDLAQSDDPLLSSPRYFYQRRDADRATIRQRLAEVLRSLDPVQSVDWENYMADLLTIATQYSQLHRGGGPVLPAAMNVRQELGQLARDRLCVLDSATIYDAGRTLVGLVLNGIR
ncbi:hypothetical protein [Sulfobacillus thermosulfidooxidans]|uniref:hypothetical protein n=1 Tax=Sulfobacillus thermosulfidooxidans TaxID=28034 RepID=UPI000421ABA1|nr:hypothetical protein [Sulfobacillus thermosulfidooxidans]